MWPRLPPRHAPRDAGRHAHDKLGGDVRMAKTKKPLARSPGRTRAGKSRASSRSTVSTRPVRRAPDQAAIDKPLPAASPGGLCVVGVGASAGGLEAFSQCCGRCADARQLAIVFVQHLSPQHESALVPLLSAQTRACRSSRPSRACASRPATSTSSRPTCGWRCAAASCTSRRVPTDDIALHADRRASSCRSPRARAIGRSASCCPAPPPTARPACATSRPAAASRSRRRPNRQSTTACRARRSPPAWST